MSIKIYVPTFKRANALVGKNYFKNAIYILPESQRDDYLKVIPAKRMIVIPEENDGNIARKRNWMLKNLERPYLSLDDDVSGISNTEKGKRKRLKQNIKLKPEEAYKIIINGFNLAHDWGCVYWGINVNTDGRNYQQYKPFSLTQPVLGPFHGHLNHNLFYDERMGTKDDYDFSLQALNKHKKILRINKYSYICLHGDNAGGIVSGRTKSIEIKYCKEIMKKWGEKIIKYRIPPRKRGDLLNGRFRAPIRGV